MLSFTHLGGLNVDKTVVFVCDMQEKFRPAIKHFPEIVTSAKKLVETSKILNVPVVVTEQYPKGLGSTVSELDVSNAACVVAKTKFSMIVPEIEEKMKSLCNGQVESVVIFGVEAHVCVEQTAIDLLERGILVHVVADATSSRSSEDRLLAFQRMRQIGCFVTTSENVIFKLMKDKEHPKFNEIRSLISTVSANTGLADF